MARTARAQATAPTKSKPSLADTYEWETYEVPWGEAECAPYHRDLDRVIIRWSDIPNEWAGNDDEQRRKPRVAKDTDTGNLFAVYSWMNDRVMFMLSDDGSGVAMSWVSCGQCSMQFELCKCPDGIHESRALTWARRRNSERWMTPKDAEIARQHAMADAIGADDESDDTASEPEKPAKRTRGTRGTRAAEKATTGRTGRARRSENGANRSTRPADDADAVEGQMSLEEISASADDVANSLLSQAMGGGKPRKGTHKKTTGKAPTGKTTGRATAPKRRRQG